MEFWKFYRHIGMKSLKCNPVLGYSHADKKNLSAFIGNIVSLIKFVLYV